MKTIEELEIEMDELERCILYETEYKHLKQYVIDYVNCWMEIQEAEYALFWQLN